MDVRAEVRRHDRVAKETFGLHERGPIQRNAASRRNAYGKALREVSRVADRDAALELSDWIETSIRARRRFPSARDVRQEGARICRNRGVPVSTGSWLGA